MPQVFYNNSPQKGFTCEVLPEDKAGGLYEGSWSSCQRVVIALPPQQNEPYTRRVLNPYRDQAYRLKLSNPLRITTPEMTVLKRRQMRRGGLLTKYNPMEYAHLVGKPIPGKEREIVLGPNCVRHEAAVSPRDGALEELRNRNGDYVIDSVWVLGRYGKLAFKASTGFLVINNPQYFLDLLTNRRNISLITSGDIVTVAYAY